MSEIAEHRERFIAEAQHASHFASRWASMRSVRIEGEPNSWLTLYKNDLWHRVRGAFSGEGIRERWHEFMAAFIDDLQFFCTPEDQCHVFDRLQAEGILAR